jgi:serine/threonine-protein kinase
MGEVFRADDLILNQPVALKFLPEEAKSNVNLLTRFYDEVRIARQISHKNVCRVYDIGEVDGQPYLSMEYIDGEELGGLLRRIGRLPSDKATEFARKLCAGVAAAHAQGVLHRDLKPANIMIDSKGELRITDFGLAAIAEQLHGDEVKHGTPAYMAPEQLRGTEVSAQSDVYAVGLVLYEMFTGKLPFHADTIAELTQLRESSRLSNPSTLAGDIDKSVERAILRCLESDPKLRPPSALALAAMLPGGDPLTAALAEGETPSPETVAAAGSDEGLSYKVAIPILAVIAMAMIAFCLIYPRIHLMNLVPFENPPEVLIAKAREIAKNLGYTDRPGDWISGFFAEGGIIQFLQSRGHNMEEWRKSFSTTPSAPGYWYRQSPRPLVTERFAANGEPGITDPPVSLPGMFTVTMDLDGKLRRFVAVPPEREPSRDNPAMDWAPLFAAAQLDMSQFKPAEPEWTPLVATETRAAWTGPYAGRGDLNVRIEAASFHGKPVYFQVLWPWTRSTRLTPDAQNTSQTIRNLVYFAVGALLIIAALWLAHYNWKAGRGDVRGAARIGVYCAVMNLIAWALGAHHVTDDAETGLIGLALAKAAFVFVEYFLLYLALEPWVRRYWPQTMITWSRVLAGRFRDPLVGRDLLLGVLFGMAYVTFTTLFEYVALRGGEPVFAEGSLRVLNGFRGFARIIGGNLFSGIGAGLLFFLTLFLLKAVLKREWLAGAVWVMGWTAVQVTQVNRGAAIAYIADSIFWGVLFAMFVVILLRFGFFALLATLFVFNSLVGAFFTSDFSTWYGESSLAVVILISAIALLGFKWALAGRPLLSPALSQTIAAK